MPHVSNSVCLFVRQRSDLARAMRESEALLAQVSQGRHDVPAKIAGVWESAELAWQPPKEIQVAVPSGIERVPVLETMGISGVWMLCVVESGVPMFNDTDVRVTQLSAAGATAHVADSAAA